MSIPMNHLKPGGAAKVLEVNTVGPMRQRLSDLGLLPGTTVERLLSSPIGDPACYRIRGAMIALRSADAAQISVAI